MSWHAWPSARLVRQGDRATLVLPRAALGLPAGARVRAWAYTLEGATRQDDAGWVDLSAP